MKPQKSTVNFYNLFFYRFVAIFNIEYHFLKIFHKKHHFFNAIIGTRINIKLGSGFYLHRGRVPGQWPLPHCQSKMADTDRVERCFRQVLIKSATIRYRKDFFHDEFKGKTF